LFSFLNCGTTGDPPATSGQGPLIIRPKKLFVNLLLLLYVHLFSRFKNSILMSSAVVRKCVTHDINFKIIIIIFHHEFRPGWPVSVSAVISSSSLVVVFQVVDFLLGDNSEVVLGACSLPFYTEHDGTTCVCMYIICLLRVRHGVILKFIHLFCG
jgi:hypothetical protein